MTRTSLHDGPELNLVPSDEFDNDGRTFYPDGDPSWEAADLHHSQTGSLKCMTTMKDGALKIALSRKGIQDLNYQDGMTSSWN